MKMFFRARLVLYMRIRECQRQNVFGIGIHGDVYYMRYNVPNGKEHIYFSLRIQVGALCRVIFMYEDKKYFGILNVPLQWLKSKITLLL